MNKNNQEMLAGAVFRITGGLGEVVGPLIEVVSKMTPAGTVEANMVAIRSRLGQMTKVDLPEELTSDFWRTDKGKKVVGDLINWQLTEMEIRKCTGVLR